MLMKIVFAGPSLFGAEIDRNGLVFRGPARQGDIARAALQGANAIGLIPIFDVVGLLNHYVLHTSDEAFLARVVHGGTTATGNFNVTAALAVITFGAIIVAGTRAHGFVQHWKNLVPHGLPGPLYVLLIPLELIGMLVRPFALTMRLAANMTGGHIAILAILSLVFVFAQMMQTSLAGVGVGVVFSLPLAVAISMLEIIVVLVQAAQFLGNWLARKALRR